MNGLFDPFIRIFVLLVLLSIGIYELIKRRDGILCFFRQYERQKEKSRKDSKNHSVD